MRTSGWELRVITRYYAEEVEIACAAVGLASSRMLALIELPEERQRALLAELRSRFGAPADLDEVTVVHGRLRHNFPPPVCECGEPASVRTTLGRHAIPTHCRRCYEKTVETRTAQVAEA